MSDLIDSTAMEMDVLRRLWKPMRGHTVIELLAAVALSGMVVSAALSLLQTTRQQSKHLIATAQRRLDAHAALSVLTVHGRLAGYGLIRADAMRIVSRDDGSLAAFGEIGGASFTARRSSDAPQPVPGSERLMLRYRADRVSAWFNRSRNTPADCEGAGLPYAGGSVTDANLQVLADAETGAVSMHCSRYASRAGGPLVSGVSNARFLYWLKGASRPLSLAQMAAMDWSSVMGFDVCLTMQDEPQEGRRYGGRDGGRRGEGVGERVVERGCHGRNVHRRTVTFRNLLY